MARWLIILMIFNTSINSEESSILFSTEDAKEYELRKRGNQGQGLFKDGKFLKFYPIVSRQDLNRLLVDLDKYSLSDEQRNKLKTELLSTYNDELRPATDEQLIETSFALSKLAEKTLANKEVECNEENGIKTPTNKTKKNEEYVYCECELPKDIKLALNDNSSAPSFDGEYWDDYSLVGNVEESSLRINTSNDNHLHGLFSKAGGQDLDGNDRGRTFGLNLDYSLIGSEGEFRVNYESVIFTQLKEADKDGYYYVNEDGEFLQDLLERNRLDVSLRRLMDKDKYLIVGVELEQLTDDGKVAGPIQRAWHKINKKNIQYDNQDYRDDEINLTVYGGLGKSWMKDIGNWKCTSKIEGTLGQNILNFDDTYIKARGEVEFNSNDLLGGREENPFVLLSAWAEGSLETEGDYTTGAGVTMSFPRQLGKWEIKPEVGFSIKDEKEDRYFSQAQSTKLEPESHIGITFSRKF